MKRFLYFGIFFFATLFFACQGAQKPTEETQKEALSKVEISTQNNPNSETSEKKIQLIKASTITFEDGSSHELDKTAGTTTIYLIRHAEKLKEGENPGLNELGQKRAESLVSIFKAYNLDRVYTTFYQRTMKTIEPVIQMMGTFSNAYKPDDLAAFAKSVLEKDKGRNILIVGHSNTTPNLVNLLSGQANKYPQIPEDEYGHFYVIQIDPTGKAKVLKLQY